MQQADRSTLSSSVRRVHKLPPRVHQELLVSQSPSSLAEWKTLHQRNYHRRRSISNREIEYLIVLFLRCGRIRNEAWNVHRVRSTAGLYSTCVVCSVARTYRTHLFGHWQLQRRVTVFFVHCVQIRLLYLLTFMLTLFSMVLLHDQTTKHVKYINADASSIYRASSHFVMCLQSPLFIFFIGRKTSGVDLLTTLEWTFTFHFSPPAFPHIRTLFPSREVHGSHCPPHGSQSCMPHC